jgi:hypothetical protein
MRRPATLLVPILLLPILRTPLSAGTVERLDIQALTRMSDAVVIAKVLATRSEWESGGKFIVTFTEIEVIEALRGGFAPLSRLSIREGGGQIGTLVIELVGAPKYRPGEFILAFLERNVGTAFQTVSMAQGAFTLHYDRTAGEIAAQRNVSYAKLSFAGGAVPSDDDSLRTSFLLPELKNKVALAIEKLGKGKEEDDEPSRLLPGEVAVPVSGAPGLEASREERR